MKKIAFIPILIIIIYIIILDSNSILFQGTELKKLNPQFVEGLALSPQVTASQALGASAVAERGTSESRGTTINEQSYLNYYQPDRFPMVVEKYVLNNNIDDNYKTDTVCVLVRASNLGNDLIENADIYEEVPENMHIINCSLPVKSSSLSEIIRYDRIEAPLLASEDIMNPKNLAKFLMSDDALSSNLRRSFSDNDTIILKNSSKDEYTIAKTISNALNNLRMNDSIYKWIRSDERYKPYLSLQTYKLLNLNNNTKMQKTDRNLLNLLLLRNILPSYIKTPDAGAKVQEKPYVDETTGIVHISISNIRPKESLIYCYYGKISSYGIHRTNTIINILNNKYMDSRVPLDIAFQVPQFDIKVDLPKTEVQPGEDINLKYIITVLDSGNVSANHRVDARLEKIDSALHINSSTIPLYFSNRELYLNKTVTINFSESGLYNIPSLIIANGRYFVFDTQKYITVEELWHKYVFELTLIFLGICTLIGPNLRKMQGKKVYPIFYYFFH